MPTYSFGEESPIKFNVSDRTARYYNEAVDKYIKAQVRFNQKFGRLWNPDADPINVKWTRRQRRAWNEFARIFNRAVKENGPFHPNEFMDDFLVKNVGLTVAVGAAARNSFGWAISAAVALGVLYEMNKQR